MVNENHIFDLIKQDNHVAFSLLFERYYKELLLYANLFLHDIDKCEDIVQSVFVKLWENRHSLSVQTSIISYLYGAVRNSCLNKLKHDKIRNEYSIYVSAFQDEVEDLNKNINFKECLEKFNASICQLPDKYREIFVLSRIHGHKYDDIANRLCISKRTVEERMKKALEILRSSMIDFLIILIVVLYGQF